MFPIILLVIAAAILILGIITARIQLVEIVSPNVGRIYFLGALTTQLLLPGKHPILRKIYGITIMRVQIIPGSTFKIRIRPDNVISHSIPVDLDIETDGTLEQIFNPEIQMMHVKFYASEVFLTKFHVPHGRTLIGYFDEDGEYVDGVLDDHFTGYSMDAITSIVPKYHPSTITEGTAVYKELKSALEKALSVHTEGWLKTDILVQHIVSRDVLARTKTVLDATSLAEADKTTRLTRLDVLEEYEKRLGIEARQTEHSSEVLKGAQVVFVGGNISDIGKALLTSMNNVRNERRSD